jgi:hypothetical protein
MRGESPNEPILSCFRGCTLVEGCGGESGELQAWVRSVWGCASSSPGMSTRPVLPLVACLSTWSPFRSHWGWQKDLRGLPLPFRPIPLCLGFRIGGMWMACHCQPPLALSLSLVEPVSSDLSCSLEGPAFPSLSVCCPEASSDWCPIPSTRFLRGFDKMAQVVLGRGGRGPCFLDFRSWTLLLPARVGWRGWWRSRPSSGHCVQLCSPCLHRLIPGVAPGGNGLQGAGPLLGWEYRARSGVVTKVPAFSALVR